MTFELYGTARLRAGLGKVTISAPKLGMALALLAEQCPALAGDVIDGETLRPAFLMSLNGDTFVTDPQTTLRDDDCVLLMAADAGG